MPRVRVIPKSAGASGLEFTSLKDFMLRIGRDKEWPNWKFFGYLEQRVPDPVVRDMLMSEGYFVRIGQNNGQDVYTLGAAGSQLVSAWVSQDLAEKTVSLSNDVRLLTWFMFVVACVALLLQVYFRLFP